MHAQLIHCLALAYLVRQNLLRWLQLYPLSTTESESGETMNQHQIADYVQHHEDRPVLCLASNVFLVNKACG